MLKKAFEEVMNRKLVLSINCPDQTGLVSSVSEFIYKAPATIVEASHHTDLEERRFFMRHEIELLDQNKSVADVRSEFQSLADKFDMEWKLTDRSEKKKLVLLATSQSHCLVDILHRWKQGELDCDIPCIIANHPEMQEYADWFNVPFHFIDFKQADADPFAEIDQLIEKYQADVVGLARFMRIFPGHLCAKYAGKIINIHHSFLPSFAGAKPYHKAYQKGVKLIGATCHYVTEDLDEGPIIEQDVLRINHSDTIGDMIRKGKECEKAAFARGLRYHLEDRIAVFNNKTIVFS